MQKVVLVLLAVFVVQSPAAGNLDFSRTMRVDYVHHGGPDGERMTLDRVSADGPWAGSRTNLIDDTGLGKYFFEVIDRATGRVLYSRGFASIYGEWETTPEVRVKNRSFHESVRFPWPVVPIRLSVRKRDPENNWRHLWATDIDPSQVNGRAPKSIGRLLSMFENGASASKVDVLLVSEGYTTAQLPNFRADARRLVQALQTFEPFRTRQSDFNFWTLEVAGTPLNVEFNIFGIPRYALTYDNRALRRTIATTPYDVVEILVNDQRFGGGGIFNQQSTVAVAHKDAEYVFVHELGHNLAGLGDEYVGNVTYETGAAVKPEPWEPNVTALRDPALLKWGDLVQPGTPIPTPVTLSGRVGAFEGAGYEATGLYRPEAECIMGSRKLIPFCRVCQRAINRIIDLHTR